MSSTTRHWSLIKPKTDGDTGDQVLSEGQTAIFRAHVNLTEADLAKSQRAGSIRRD